MTFTEKLISISVQLASNTGTNQPNTFSESGSNMVTLTGSRASVRVTNAGAPTNCRAQVKIWGLTPSLMNQLTTLGLVYNQVQKNVLTAMAGDATSGMSTVFSGTILNAYGDYAAQPNTSFNFECISTGAAAVVPAKATSIKGTTNVSDVMSTIAKQMGLTFENNSVTTQISNPYLSGSLLVQAKKLADHAGILWGILPPGTLAIWPNGGSRKTMNVPTISAAAGNLIEYPSFTQQGIIVKVLFTPDITFGSMVKVDSSIIAGISQAQPNANFASQWAVKKLDLALDTLLPKGDWMSTCYCYNVGFAKAVIPPAS